MKSLSKLFPLVILVIAVENGSVQGNAGLPFLRDLNDNGFAAVRFEHLSDYPNYDFFLQSEGMRKRVQSGEIIQPYREGTPPRARGKVCLVAVPEEPRRSPTTPQIASGKPKPHRLVSEPLDGISAGTGYVVPYRVRIVDDKLIVTMQPREWLPGAQSQWWFDRSPCIAVPVACCVALAWLGVRMARRRFPPKPVRPPVGENRFRGIV
jgi:hypothetical protein